MIPNELIIAALSGGIIALDKSSLQMLFSEPLIICSAAGAYLGEFESGVLFGMLWQLIWAGELPIGASKVPDGSAGALISICLYKHLLENCSSLPNIALLSSVIAGVASSYFSGQFISDKRRFHIRYNFWADGFIERNQPWGISLLFSAGVVEQFLSGVLHTGIVFLLFANVFRWTMSTIPTYWDGLFGGTLAAIWGTAAAAIVALFWNRKSLPAIITGIILSVIIAYKLDIL